MKKIYVIMQRATEYNDEYDAVTEGANLWKAFRDRKNAEGMLAQAKLEAISDKTPGYDESWPSDMAYIQEIEVEDQDVIGYSESLARAKKAKEKASRLAKDEITKSVESLFKKFPSLIGFRWTQYTPYFNDGNECVFSVHSDWTSLKFDGMEDYEDKSEIEQPNPSNNPDSKTLYFKEGNSDKVYQVSIDKVLGGFMVNAAYGRRGSTLQFTTKTEKPVSREEAQALFDKLILEKTNKGYGESLEPYPVEEVGGTISEILEAIDEDDMKEVFGDHVEITATRDGFEVEEYSHD